LISVQTEEFVPRFQRRTTPYRINDIRDVDWDKQPDWLYALFFPLHFDPSSLPKPTRGTISNSLQGREIDDVELALSVSLKYHAEDELFYIFQHLIQREPFPVTCTFTWVDRHPPLVFVLLKTFPPDPETHCLPEILREQAHRILRALTLSANELKIATLVGMEKISESIRQIALADYFELLSLTALSIRSQQLVQEVLLVLNDCRTEGETNAARRYGYRNALAVAFDVAEEAADECPCDENGRPRRQKTPPTQTRLTYIPGEEPSLMKAAIRVDAKCSARLHSHIRLEASSKPENRWISIPILDGLVIQAGKGELRVQLLYPPPPEVESMNWNLYTAGSIGKLNYSLTYFRLLIWLKATSRAMTDAILKLLTECEQCCAFHSLITGEIIAEGSVAAERETVSSEFEPGNHLNASQRAAVMSLTQGSLSLIWGPPGIRCSTCLFSTS